MLFSCTLWISSHWLRPSNTTLSPERMAASPCRAGAINAALISFFLVLGHHFNFYYFSCPINALKVLFQGIWADCQTEKNDNDMASGSPLKQQLFCHPLEMLQFLYSSGNVAQARLPTHVPLCQTWLWFWSCEEPVSYHSARNTTALAPLLSNSVCVRLSKKSWQVSEKTIAALALICMPSLEILCH